MKIASGMRKILSIFFILQACALYAQVGYQVSLLDTKTGNPRVNEKVSVEISITNSEGTHILSESKTVTSDDFGVLSMTIGNGSTFNDVDWNKMPLYISASVDGINLGKSQILTVPIAEYAKHYGVLTYEMLEERCFWPYEYDSYTFHSNGTMTSVYYTTDENGIPCQSVRNYKYEIDGNLIYIFHADARAQCVYYSHKKDKLYLLGD